MLFLGRIDIPSHANSDAFPFTLPVIKQWRPLEFNSPVTFFAGENGSGKSTLLESLAVAAGSIAIGSQSVQDDRTLDPLRPLAHDMKLTWNRRTHAGFYLRSEDVFGFAKFLTRAKAELCQDLEEVEQELVNSSGYARTLARIPIQASLAGLDRYGDLNCYSHGESFLRIFRDRIVTPGLYLLDEPEAPLSFQNQLGLLAILHEAVSAGSQFIVATHSPILLAYPQAEILSFDCAPIARISFSETPQVKLARDFLNQPEAFLRHIFGEN